MVDVADGNIRAAVDFEKMVAKLFQIRRIIPQSVLADVALVAQMLEKLL
jgi:hypothetical protein